jgi:adenosine kinase
MLGGEPLIMATVGEDAEPYYRRLDALGIARTHVREVAGTYTAQAFITTDLDDNQITAFHPGAMGHSHLNNVAAAGDVGLAIVSPDGREGMLQHARELKELNIPFVFDPGQGLPMFSGAELLEFVKLASYVTVNSYEGKMLEERTGESLADLAKKVEALIVTHGSAGSEIHTTPGNSVRYCGRHRRSDRLRGCLSCRAAVRHRRRHGLALDRTDRLPDGRTQNRRARWAKPSRHTRRDRGALPPAFQCTTRIKGPDIADETFRPSACVCSPVVA